MPCCALLRRQHNEGLQPTTVMSLHSIDSLSLTRRNYMLDVIIVVVTILTFIVFIGFTEGCERL